MENIYGKYNFTKVKFSLDLLPNPEEKLSHLYKLKLDVNKLILCFENSLSMPLSPFLNNPNIVDIGCDELKEFIQTTRKFAIPLFEYLDSEGYTVRSGDVRKKGHKL